MSLDLFSANLTGVVSRSKQIAGTFELIYRLHVWKKFDQISNDYYTPSRFGQARNEITYSVKLYFEFFWYFVNPIIIILPHNRYDRYNKNVSTTTT